MAPTLCEGRYRILSVLGEGGMSTVYAAHDERLGVQRAVKILSPALVHHSSLRKRFEAEARTTARLRHAHIVTVHDVGSDHGRTFMVLELMTGGSLMARVEAIGPLPPRMASQALIAVLSALQYAHERGVVHRDVKPHNILVDQEGVPKLTDFGIARVLSSEEALTRTGAAIGTPAYMAPEQRGKASQVDGRADIFSAGATLYTLLTGREPFDIYAAELQERLFADVPALLRPIIQRATRYAPEDRYPNCAAMIADLEAIIGQLPPDPEDALPLGAPLPGRVGPPRRQRMETEDEPVTFDDSDVEGDAPPPLGAFPSLSGLEQRERLAGGTDIERSLNTREDAPAERHSYALALLALLGIAVVMAAATALVLWKVGEDAAPAGAEPAESASTAPPSAPEQAAALSTEAAAVVPTTPEAATAAEEASAPSTSEEASRPARGATGASSPATRPAASAPSPEAAAPASQEPGTLSVSSKPRADVFLDGRHQGRTRWKAELAPRAWRLLLESEEGGRHEVELLVRPGEETSYCWDFKRAEPCAR